MATLNSVYYLSPGKQIFVDNNSNQFVVSGYKLSLDPNLNTNLTLGNVPTMPNDIGAAGTISFDRRFIYYCWANNNWTRARLASWTNDNTINPSAGITNPSNYWYLTVNGETQLGDTSFIPSPNNPTFNSSGVTTNSVGLTGTALYAFTNFAYPGWTKAALYYGLAEGFYPNSFSVAFETKRINSSGFLLGSKYGQQNFHFEFSGSYLLFRMPKSNGGGVPDTGNWHSIRSISQFNNTNHYQVVATFDPSDNSIAKFYVNGVLQGSDNYHTNTVSLYNAGFSFGTIQQARGFGIGGTPFGNINGAQSNTLTERNSSIVRNLGFWNHYVLNQTEVTALYNGGTFRKFPF
jgi:hypothetical protein